MRLLIIELFIEPTYMFRSPSVTILRVYSDEALNKSVCVANLKEQKKKEIIQLNIAVKGKLSPALSTVVIGLTVRIWAGLPKKTFYLKENSEKEKNNCVTLEISVQTVVIVRNMFSCLSTLVADNFYCNLYFLFIVAINNT
jgi:hypothetical protein